MDPTLNSKYNILIVDDEPLIRKSLFEILKMQGFRCQMAASAKEAIETIAKQKFNIVITDMKLPEMSGIALLKKIKQDHPDIEVIVITGYGSIETAVEAMKLKAFDYITKPIVDDEIKIILGKIVEKFELLQENTDLKKMVAKSKRDTFEGIVGACTDMVSIYNLIESIATTNATILITGESGTGKGIVARAIHQADATRRQMPFVEVSCGALSETLLESELFGHAKGSFTGAIKDKKGRFEVANGGTIFLDEIDTCTPSLQIKLLRILQDGTFERVGETTTQKTDARVIAATNQNLSKLVDEGKFREDLYYRIHVIPITLPALRNRKDDIDLLVRHFIARYNKKNNKKIQGISEEVRDLFMNYSWPGNVRQLENVIEGAMIMASGEIINKENLPKSFNDREKHDIKTSPSAAGKSLKEGLKDPEREIILAALKETNNNRSKAAVKLGINRTTLYNTLKKYGIES
jgi:DNA-binding NtrC family response regulator